MEHRDSRQWSELLFRPGPQFGGENSEIIAEDLGAMLIEHGASGATVERDSRVRCFFIAEGSQRIAEDSLAIAEGSRAPSENLASGTKIETSARTVSEHQLLACAESFGFVLCKRNVVGDRNWVQECSDVWQPLRLGTLTLNPVLSLEAAPQTPRPPRELRLIPGFGFGTGHHPTTAMILEALQKDAAQRAMERPSWPQSAIDVGTGSGILALGVCECFEIAVDAVDIDPLALSNARDNLSLNGREESITLVVGELGALQGSYDLIVANLYAEVLETLSADLAAKLNPGGLLIVSGIAAALLERVRTHYQASASGLKLVRTEERGDWAMIVFESSRA
jgi:ribosomal protein L11 methyltransferase